MKKTITHGPGGWRAEFYTDDDDDSGYGEEAMIGLWYGSRDACERITADDVVFVPMTEYLRNCPN